MVARTACNRRVASSSLACVTFVFFIWQGRLVHVPMNTASRGLSVHSKSPQLSTRVSTGNVPSFFVFRCATRQRDKWRRDTLYACNRCVPSATSCFSRTSSACVKSARNWSSSFICRNTRKVSFFDQYNSRAQQQGMRSRLYTIGK